MAAFAPASTLTQSADGKTVVITDTSNYEGNTDGVTIDNIGARSYAITDGNGDAITSGTFTGVTLTQTFNLDADAYLHTALSFTLASNVVRTGSNNYLAENYYNTGLVKIAKKLKCDCGCSDICDNTLKAMACKEAAVFYFLYGYAENAQEMITDANMLIND
jgi:hypothetical protein